MGRWTQYDEDEYRLPEGMKRVGYDADSGRYTFKDRDGSLWLGAEGAEFSEMTRVSDGPTSGPSRVEEEEVEEEEDVSPTRSDGYQLLSVNANSLARKQHVNPGAYRTLFPFFLIIAVVLLLIWQFIVKPSLSVPADLCPTNTTGYWVQPGDSCWEISQAHGCSLEELVGLNPKLKCEALMPGETVCLPDKAPAPTSSHS